MKKELIESLTTTFEAHVQQTEGGVEYCLARDLQHLLGYTKWDNFLSVVSKAKTACELSGHEVKDHFADVGKMVGLGSLSRRINAWDLACLSMNSRVESSPQTPYTSLYIRPLAVRPLDHPERWPTPRGFLFSGSNFATGRLQ